MVPGEVGGLVVEDGRLTGVRLTDDSVLARSAVFVAPRLVPRTALLEGLGAELREPPFGTAPVIDETGRTTVPGAWTAGNVGLTSRQVVHAAGNGSLAAAISGEPAMEDIGRAAGV